jgi:ATP-dependent DNA ligase
MEDVRAFDLLTCDGKDLRTERLLDRKQELRRLLARPTDSLLKYSTLLN